jgi:pyruvate/2-oxoacid:ferredoxin oxidoreductase beta subunit/NAD-dependent dihydropyrimidine dehydrogenase PreA subunit
MEKIPSTAPTIEDRLETLIDVEDFNNRVINGYNEGSGSSDLEADVYTARSIIPGGTGAYRDFSYIAPEIPLYDPSNCVGCMECVIECPDTAILGKVVEPDSLESELDGVENLTAHAIFKSRFVETQKYTDSIEKKGEEGGLFGIFIDPTKCKGCAECVEACGDHQALSMIPKTDTSLKQFQDTFDFYNRLPDTPKRFISDRLLTDMMLSPDSLLYVGGAGSCMGCGEATALRMMVAATGFVHGPENMGMVASTGCNTVYTSTYPYNPYTIPWANSLFENGATFAMGVRSRWDQMGWEDKKLWVVGGDGAFLDIGFQSLSRMIMSGMNINVLVLDTQVYSNTGGQASTASFMAQRADMADHGKELKGKSEHRKELANICLMHPNVYVAQTTCAHINHFYRSIMEANEYDGPSVVIAYSTCQPEHGVADNMAMHQAKLAVDSRAFPLIVYDPRKGNSIKERLDLKGNPSVKEDWYTIRKTGEVIDFTTFARSEGRFSKHFDKEGTPSPELLASKQERLENWHLLQELAGISKAEATKTVPTQKTSASADAAAKQKAALMAKRKVMKASAGDTEDGAAKQKAALLAKLKAKKKQK